MNYISSLLHPQDNVEEIVALVCHDMGIKVTRTVLSRQLKLHPDYPSLSAISNYLHYYGVDSLALKTNGLQSLSQIPDCFLVQIRPEGGYELLGYVYCLSEESVDWYNPITHHRETIRRDLFSQLFTGYIMLFDATNKKSEDGYIREKREELVRTVLENLLALSVPVITSISLIGYSLHSGSTFSWFPIAYTTLLLLGCLFGFALLLYEYNEYSPVIRKVCSLSRKTSCGAVLHSKASRLFGIPWSVIGTAYFVGMLMAIVVSGYSAAVLRLSTLLHLLTLPYICYSLYYQHRVARQWCPLCLAVLVVIALQFVTALCSGVLMQGVGLAFDSVVGLTLSLSVSFSALFFLWHLSRENKLREYYEQSLARLKYNKEVFTALLHKGQPIVMPTDDYGILLGNPHGCIHIVKVCNPYCSHCATAQPVLQELADRNPEVKLQVVFAVDPDSANYKDMPIDRFLSLHHEGADMESIMTEWYTNPRKDKDGFEKNHPVSQSYTSSNYDNAKKMYQFCKNVEITGTPTIFINGYKLPSYYRINDLLYCI